MRLMKNCYFTQKVQKDRLKEIKYPTKLLIFCLHVFFSLFSEFLENNLLIFNYLIQRCIQLHIFSHKFNDKFSLKYDFSS